MRKGIIFIGLFFLLLSCPDLRQYYIEYEETGDAENSSFEGAEETGAAEISWNKIFGSISSAGDTDYYVIELPAGAESVTIEFEFDSTEGEISYSDLEYFNLHLIESTNGLLNYHYFVAEKPSVIFTQSSPVYLYVVVLGNSGFSGGSYIFHFKINSGY